MCTFEVLPFRVDIVNYLVPRWHVSSTSCNLFMLFGVKMMLDCFTIYHRDFIPNISCTCTFGILICGRNC